MHLGEEIRRILAEKHISQAELGRRIHRSRSDVHHILNRESLDTALLAQVSLACSFNFFELLAGLLCEQYPDLLTTVSKPQPDSLANGQLKTSLEHCQRENQLLREMVDLQKRFLDKD